MRTVAEILGRFNLKLIFVVGLFTSQPSKASILACDQQ